MSSLNLADGQLGASAAQILAGATVGSVRIDAVLHNTGSNEETVVLTFQRNGGTARRIARAVLDENEALVLSALPVESGDVLLGVTSNASVVDYLISVAADGPRTITIYDENGLPKSAPAILEQLATIVE